MSEARRAVVVSTIIDRSSADVWVDVRNIDSHVTWMDDAVEIQMPIDRPLRKTKAAAIAVCSVGARRPCEFET